MAIRQESIKSEDLGKPDCIRRFLLPLQMLPLVNQCIDEALEILDKESGDGTKTFDLYPIYQRMTLDVISRVAFGSETSVQRGSNEEFYEKVKSIFSVSKLRNNIFSILATLFPEIKGFWRTCADVRSAFFEIPIVQLRRQLRQAVKERKQVNSKGDHSAGQERIKDFIDLMLEAEAEAGWEEKLAGDSANDNSLLKIDKKLTVEETVEQMLVFLIAGYDTTSTALAFVSFLLATNPKAQDRLLTEIDRQFKDDTDINYDSVTKLTYLDWVIRESLRMYPNASIVVARRSMSANDAVLLNEKKSVVKIPAGVTIAADVWSVHYDPELWGEDAEEFRPERMSPEESKGRHPMAWMPFGGGPRTCLGMRFANIEEKLFLARLLRRYRFVATKETPAELKLLGQLTVGPQEVRLSLERR